MALTEDRVLVSFEINIPAKSIQVLWQDRILRDGQVEHVSNHRGAYPLNEDGLPDDSVVTEMGTSISDALGETLAGAQRDIAQLQIDNQTLLSQNQALIAEITRLREAQQPGE